MDIVTLGTKIAEVAGKLKALREKRDEVNKAIEGYEKELQPLLAAHSKLIAEMVGAPPPPPPAPPTVRNADDHAMHGSGPGFSPDVMEGVKKRILAFLEDAEPGTSPMDIAAALKLPPTVVRQVMADMARAGR